MSQDFEFTDQPPPHESFKPGETTPPPPPPSFPSKPTSASTPVVARPDSTSHRSSVPIGAVILVLLALAGGLGYFGIEHYKKNPSPSATATSDAPNAAPASSGSTGSLAAEVEDLRASLKATSARVDELAARPVPDLKPLENRVAAIEKNQESLSGIPARLSALDEKVGAMGKAEPSGDAQAKVDAVDKRVGELSQAIDAVKADLAAMATSTPKSATNAEATKPVEDINVADEALSQGADLFKQGKYAESLEVFTKLQAEHPEDARVWYFSALANGLSTRNWRGETERLVTLGVEKEKAGSPETSKIDAVFSGLTTANGKDWLAAYRARAATR